jgi:hypothetical protein
MKLLDTKKIFRPLALALVLLMFASATCWATEMEEIESLKTRLNELENRVADEAGLEKEAESQGPVLSGAIRFNYNVNDFNDSEKDKGGDLKFDLFQLGVDGSYQDLFYSAQYRWNSYQDFVHHAYIGYHFSDTLQAQLGITQVPFGNMPYEYHNFWGGIPYYIGLDDDLDMGVKVIKTAGPWDLQVAFFKNDEWGSASKLERYSYDVVSDGGDQANEETNQVNARLAYTADYGDFGQTEIGLSGEWGQLYNSVTADMGDHWAAAVHLNGNYGPFNLLLQVAEYRYNPKNPTGVDDRSVLMGGFSDSFSVAAEGTVYSGGLSYGLPVNWGPISKLTFYEDYSRLVKKESGFEDSQLNTVGCMVTAGNVYTYIDVISGKNTLYVGGPRNSFAVGEQDPDWATKFNINIGWYF